MYSCGDRIVMLVQDTHIHRVLAIEDNKIIN